MPLSILRDSDEQELVFDAVLDETFAYSNNVTSMPVENGVVISDHIQASPDTFSATVIITETPVFTRTNNLPTGIDRVLEARAFLKSLSTQLCTVVSSRYGVLEDMALVSWAMPVNQIREVMIPLQFVKVRVVDASIVALPRLATKRKKQSDKEDLGPQATTGDTGESRSILSRGVAGAAASFNYLTGGE